MHTSVRITRRNVKLAYNMQSSNRFREVNDMERDGSVSGNDYFPNEINAVRAKPAAGSSHRRREVDAVRVNEDAGVSKQLQTSSGTSGAARAIIFTRDAQSLPK